MNFRLSAKAEADLIKIYVDGVADFGAIKAEAYQDKLDETMGLIADNPEMARLRDEITPPVRIHPVHAHVIIYLVDDNRRVRILRVRHANENWSENPIE